MSQPKKVVFVVVVVVFIVVVVFVVVIVVFVANKCYSGAPKEC